MCPDDEGLGFAVSTSPPGMSSLSQDHPDRIVQAAFGGRGHSLRDWRQARGGRPREVDRPLIRVGRLKEPPYPEWLSFGPHVCAPGMDVVGEEQ